MIPAILGKKLGMTQVYDDNGQLIPVTVVQAGPCTVLQVKTTDGADGYDAVQVGLEDIKAHRAKKPAIGHAAKAETKPKRFVREFLNLDATEVEVGEVFSVEVLDGIKYVDIEGVTKGKGFAGPMKRYGFGGQPASHGTERKHRSPGSIGGHGTNLGMGGKIKKGKRMGGHMGHVTMTSRNHQIVKIDAENRLLLIKGALPGAKNGLLTIRKSKTAKNND